MKYRTPIRNTIAAALLLSFAGTASAFTLEWFPKVPGLEDETFLVYTSKCNGAPSPAGAPKLTLVDAESGYWNFEITPARRTWSSSRHPRAIPAICRRGRKRPSVNLRWSTSTSSRTDRDKQA